MYLPIELKNHANQLRKHGYSIKEVASKLNISTSTASLWLRDIQLSSRAQNRLAKRQILGQYKTRLIKLEQRQIKQNLRFKQVNQLLSNIKITKDLAKLCCSLLYWCEGNKDNDTSLRFTNSDPKLIRTYLSLLRLGFNITESKFRVLMHLHQYHNEERQKDFWFKTTNIPNNQFNKTYLKPNTGTRKHDNYPGCIAISYYDAEVAKEIMAIYNAFVPRGVG